MLEVLHNPRCGKSRNCLAFLTELKQEFEIIPYLQDPLSVNEIQELIKKLHISPMALVRQKEPIWIENFKNKSLTDDDIINALQKFPILIERPIVIKGKKAIIGRDLEKVSEFLLT